MNPVGSFSTTAGRSHDDESRRAAMLRGIHVGREIYKALRRPVDDGLIARQLHLECGPTVRCVDDRVDFLTTVRLSPGVHRATERLRIDANVTDCRRLEVESGGLEVGEQIP